mmetsp:Transcript_45598/g.105808  ORF Transcript_45598/g.105808 Transcript_45598/m.105808 type:complete len:211 (+) Transcript_45598:1552-2184(+)
MPKQLFCQEGLDGHDVNTFAQVLLKLSMRVSRDVGPDCHLCISVQKCTWGCDGPCSDAFPEVAHILDLLAAQPLDINGQKPVVGKHCHIPAASICQMHLLILVKNGRARFQLLLKLSGINCPSIITKKVEEFVHVILRHCFLHWHRCWLFVLLLANGVCMEDPSGDETLQVIHLLSASVAVLRKLHFDVRYTRGPDFQLHVKVYSASSLH